MTMPMMTTMGRIRPFAPSEHQDYARPIQHTKKKSSPGLTPLEVVIGRRAGQDSIRLPRLGPVPRRQVVHANDFRTTGGVDRA